MKTIMAMGSLVATLMVFQGMAQNAENDDMYFNSKDREKKATVISANDKIDIDYNAFKKKHFDENDAVTENTNPTDSYSARSINPEYISRSHAEQASEDEQNYYVEGYTPPNTFDSYSSENNAYTNNSTNNNLNYNNSYYPYGNSSSPYYGSCNSGMSPYYSGGSGLSLSMSYMWGNGWGSGWNYGMGYSSGGSYYNPYGYSGYGYPTYVYSGSDVTNVNHRKRPSRHSAIVSATRQPTQTVTSTTGSSSNGRSRQVTDEYYVKPSRRALSTLSNSSADRYSWPGSTSNNTRSRESYNNTRESRPTYSAPSRSSTPSRSSGGSSSRSRR